MCVRVIRRGQLRICGCVGTHLVTLQIFNAGTEQGRTRARDLMRGVAVGRRRWVGDAAGRQPFLCSDGDWPSGLYFAAVVRADGRVGYAPFVLRPRRRGHRRIAMVLPTQTWQAYNLRDDDGDGRADAWYARDGATVRLSRPFVNRGVPPAVPPLRPAVSPLDRAHREAGRHPLGRRYQRRSGGRWPGITTWSCSRGTRNTSPTRGATDRGVPRCRRESDVLLRERLLLEGRIGTVA